MGVVLAEVNEMEAYAGKPQWWSVVVSLERRESSNAGMFSVWIRRLGLSVWSVSNFATSYVHGPCKISPFSTAFIASVNRGMLLHTRQNMPYATPLIVNVD